MKSVSGSHSCRGKDSKLLSRYIICEIVSAVEHSKAGLRAWVPWSGGRVC